MLSSLLLRTPCADALPGVWHCPQCVKKKLLFGVHSVSDGVESIWDVREVEVSNGGRQRQYLVKYHGLAHIHNHWVPEKQLLLENPCLVSSFRETDQIVRWTAEWTVPDRLLGKRPIKDKVYIASSAVISVCNFEWLVKWRGLSYDHATWELDNASFLSSSLGQNLMRNYEIRHRKAKQQVNQGDKGSISQLSELPVSGSHVNDNVLKNVNKLRECLFKCQNAVVFDDQERAMTVTSFIESMNESARPFLIVTASGSLSQWEAEFAQLVPSVDVVVYNGNKDTRKGLEHQNFMKKEDLDILGSIRWEAIVIDECQQSWISDDLEQIKMLNTKLRIVLVSCQIKDQTSEYLKILSLLESNGDFDKLRGYRFETNDNLCKLKDRLSRFIAYGSTSQVSKFLEYWVPVQISNYQLEQYCATLLSNSIPLRSCSRNHPVRALHDILLTVRKCCDHPYLLDPSVQERLFAEQRPAAELLDIGIEASGKLKLLDTMLTEIKTRGLRVLYTFSGSGGASTGDILDDFLRQRFGQHTYERIDAGVILSKKQAAVNRFNKKETGQFVFLLDNRACSSVIKLSSLDIVVIYDSGWNPANDLRALQKISIDSKVEQIKVFRLYSSFTVEERALLLAKKNLHLDNNSENFSWATSNSLLSWGALHLFNKLEEYHADSNSTSALNFSSEHLLLNEVTKEFQAILSESREDTDSNAVISKVKLGVGSYSSDIPLIGEAQIQLKDGEEPHVFWKNLLDGKLRSGSI
ncbi:UNVERIFIED_CONTAM: Helicase protein MOM1 [Sesamum radiatum]|uniref:Helicase protein MOM1 n=1 Tax=Sesamum radiatum TaxID=300843 RepID=A0AAW2S9M2_SESRA